MKKLTDGGMPAKAAMRLAGFTEAQVAEAFPAGTGIGESSNTPPTVTTMPATKSGGTIKGTPPKAGAPVVRVA